MKVCDAVIYLDSIPEHCTRPADHFDPHQAGPVIWGIQGEPQHAATSYVNFEWVGWVIENGKIPRMARLWLRSRRIPR